MGRETERILYIPKKDQVKADKTHEIWFNDRITEDSTSVLRNIIEKINVADQNEEITLKINSPGGLVWEVIYLAEYFKNIKNPLKTIAEARCASGAVLLVAAGDKRLAWQNCQFLIHGIQLLNFTFSGPIHKLKEQAEAYEELNLRFLGMLSEFTGQPLSRIQLDTQTDTVMTSGEAKAYGIIDDIIPRVKTRPPQTMKKNNPRP